MQQTNPKSNLDHQIDQEGIRSRFSEFFNHKGVMGAIANKAFRNLQLKTGPGGSGQDQAFHYFLIGHLFKHIDTQALFAPVLDESGTRQEPSRFVALQAKGFDFSDQFFSLLKSIRNVNSHYIHTFDCLRLDNLNPKLWHFIRAAFELSSILSLIGEKEITAEDYFADSRRDEKLVEFWCEKFFPDTVHQERIRTVFLGLNKARAIDRLLRIDLDHQMDWEVIPGHPVFTVQPGRYLSFHASMLVVCMSLYKNEANQLVSKMKGFKRNDDNVYRSKRQIFTGLSKRFSSQDNDHEQQHLIKFRDLIQYLNHYPTPWNGMLEPGADSDAASRALKEAIVDMEIRRMYPEVFIPDSDTDPDRFATYARYQLFGDVIKNPYKKAFIASDFSSEEIRAFNDILHTSDETKGLRRKLADLRRAPHIGSQRRREIENTERELAVAERFPNREVDKLLQRLDAGQFFASYGRNQDRFMELALRYLLETGYFGPEARVCAYQFLTTDEQQAFLSQAKEEVPKRQYDKFKFHQGKLMHFTTYADHLNTYPEWDMPFVIRNNAAQVQLPIDTGDLAAPIVCKTLTIQRVLMPYLLEHALYHSQPQKGDGQSLLSAYYRNYRQLIAEDYALLHDRTTISSEEKTRLKKRFPKRLLHTYDGSGNPQPRVSSLRNLLNDAKEQEVRYELLLKDARKKGTEADFVRRNKGRQFKLRFIRRAWHELYFKQSYAHQVALHDGQHHKSFHITREEFNDFSRWMFAFGEVPQYKEQLEKLFTAKGFFQVEAFRSMFDAGRSLDDWYQKTKIQFTAWLAESSHKAPTPKQPTVAAYTRHMSGHDLFINLSDFIAFLNARNIISTDAAGRIQYQGASNFPFLHHRFYTIDDRSAAPATLCKRIGRQRLEDALLYELATHYLYVDEGVRQKIRHHVALIQQEDVELDLKDFQGNDLYRLAIPFHKIGAFAELLTHKQKQETDPKHKGTSFLGNLKNYIHHAKDEKDIKPIYQDFVRTGKLTYDGLQKVNAHLAAQSVRFTEIAMALERYYIGKNGIILNSGNYIDIKKISKLKNYFQKQERNKAFHFGVPQQTYRSVIEKIEQRFIADEVKPTSVKAWDDLPGPMRNVCNLLLNEMHEHFYDRKIVDGAIRLKQARNRFMEEVAL